MSNTLYGSILFKAASVVDGSEHNPAYKADVLVQDDKIAFIRAIGDNTDDDASAVEAARVIDCEDGKWTLSPGFIDMHAHSDLSLLHTPEHLAKITQGTSNMTQTISLNKADCIRRYDRSHWSRWHFL